MYQNTENNTQVILRSCMPTKILLLIYIILIQSIINYGITSWGCAVKTHIKPLELIEKKIIKICLNKTQDCSTK